MEVVSVKGNIDQHAGAHVERTVDDLRSDSTMANNKYELNTFTPFPHVKYM
jgi:hypothetical protein